MKAFNIYIKDYDWIVRIFVKVTHIDTDEVMSMLRSIGCKGKDLSDSYKLLSESNENTGICYSNTKERISVIVFLKTSTADEFYDSSLHEIFHLAIHIAMTDGIDLSGEEICYLGGDIGKLIFPYVKKLLCCQCRDDKMYKKYLITK